ncbi:PAS domain S-box protein [Salibacterium salarium]|uniref:PAS domain S-box protein n=1 Tax=Salibacterium salarium TaxID=284579 RepID=A0A3R9QU60_9BACI|nr:sigma 54-interacting transcriptional regulator [Salibacterium salarium]RSL33545.1 PAS domain S-box protein [Salibacterium salarium]
MRHYFPDLKRLVNKRFLIFSSVNELITRLNDGYREEEGIYYYQKNGSYFHVRFNGNTGIEVTEELIECFSVELPVLNRNASKQELISVLETAEYVVMVDKYDFPEGIIDAKSTLSLLFHSYSYLYSYFETMIDTMDASISMIDEKERTVVWTSGAEQIFSIKKEDILGKPMTEFFQESMLKCRDSLYTGQSFHRYQHQPRHDLFVLINTQPIYLNGKVIGAVAAEVDVTSHVQLHRELYQANQKISDLEQKMQKLNSEPDPFLMINGKSDELEEVKEKIKKVSSTEATILIYGETGVGKELFAKAIHQIREPTNAPFIAINCGAISPTLFESELFGYEKGAFSGALNKGKAGKVELAKGGTLFLDEIGELPFDMQVKFLRVLQENYYFPVGGTKELQVDCRIVAATNKDLDKLVAEGKFREDLFYRLNTIPLTIPPLRKRKDDIVEITHLYLYELSSKYQRQIELVSPEAMQFLMEYPWPGNIRELKNVIEHIVVFHTSDVVQTRDLPERIKQRSSASSPAETSHAPEPTLRLKEEMELHEKHIIRKVLEKEKGNKNLAAATLDISRATLYNKLNKHQLGQV